MKVIYFLSKYRLVVKMIGLSILLFIASASALPSSFKIGSRIVGGHDVDISDFPYQVSMTYYLSHRCGGSIISEYWVLTAAHCIEDAWPYELYFRAGSTDSTRNGTFHMAEEIILHPKYNASYNDYDFCLVKVKTPFNFSDPNVKVIEFADYEPEANTMMTVSGWGTLWDNGEASKYLKAVDLPIIDRKICRAKYNEYAPELPNMITDRMICAGFEEGGKDACQGDSGSPMVDKKTRKLHGIVSWAFGCAYPHVPGVYSNVANLEIRQWIKQISGVK